MKTKNVRALAATIIACVINGDGSLSTHLEKHKSIAESALLQELCFGCCRWYFQLDSICNSFLSSPLKAKDLNLKCLLLVGIYQLRALRIPDHAAINETVSAVKELKKPWAKPLVNGVLREYLRKKNEVETQLASADPNFNYSHPKWLIEELKNQWPDQWLQILDANNHYPPMTLRVNRRRNSRQEYLDKLESAGISASPGRFADSAIYLEQACGVNKLPGFADGDASIQDEASQLVPDLLQLVPGLRVLDACAAPGGKTCHLLESEHSPIQITSLERSEGRYRRILENLERLQLKAQVLVADASQPDQWWNGALFDRILLDPPCSATGVIRRHPDIKLLRSVEDIQKLVETQQNLLSALWACLKPGGLLLYTTCSVLKQENEEIVASFLARSNNVKYEAIVADWGVECRYGRQLFPIDNCHDGFFYSLLSKNSRDTNNDV
jgi:16S rRNA (cytosine967-C5)-methyltransferase